MVWNFIIPAAATLLGSAVGSRGARKAADTQAGAARAGIAEQARQFDRLDELLAPYRETGQQALSSQGALLGLEGPEAQQAAIDQLQQSPQFQSLMQQGESSLLQNASATGGLRGGNLQRALGEFRPNLLSQLINQQFQNLGGLTSLGQQSSAFTGNAGMQSAANTANLLGQAGAAQAGGQLAQSKILGNAIGSLGGLATQYFQRPQIDPSVGSTPQQTTAVRI